MTGKIKEMLLEIFLDHWVRAHGLLDCFSGEDSLAMSNAGAFTSVLHVDERKLEEAKHGNQKL